MDVKNLNAFSGSQINDYSKSNIVKADVINQVNQSQSKESETSETSETESSTGLILSGQRGSKIKLFRVIIALLESGIITNKNGDKPTQEEIFSAFGQMLGTDFTDFQNHLSMGSKSDPETSASVFDDLKQKYLQYEDRKLSR